MYDGSKAVFHTFASSGRFSNWIAVSASSFSFSLNISKFSNSSSTSVSMQLVV